jgi:hypothetical protein
MNQPSIAKRNVTAAFEAISVHKTSRRSAIIGAMSSSAWTVPMSRPSTTSRRSTKARESSSRTTTFETWSSPAGKSAGRLEPIGA